MRMFEYINYRLSGQEIENVNYPGQATTMFGMLTYSDDFQKNHGLNMMFYRDSSRGLADTNKNSGFNIRHNHLIEDPKPKGFFSCRIPLKLIVGFADDYNKVIWGFTHQLTVKRKSEDDVALFRDDKTTDGKITLQKLSWYVPHVRPSDVPAPHVRPSDVPALHVRPSDEQRFKMYKIIENKSTLKVGFGVRECDSKAVEQTKHFNWSLSIKASAEKPRWIIIGFQTDKLSDQDKNASIFDHVNLKNIYVRLNTIRYPKVDYDLSFKQSQFSRAYGDAADFKS